MTTSRRDGTRWTSLSDDTNRSNPSTKYESHFPDFRDRKIIDFFPIMISFKLSDGSWNWALFGNEPDLPSTEIGWRTLVIDELFEGLSKGDQRQCFQHICEHCTNFQLGQELILFWWRTFPQIVSFATTNRYFQMYVGHDWGLLRAQCRILLHHED